MPQQRAMVRTIIGVDEAGRGPVIGPLVVSALEIPNEDIILLKELEIIDSKKMSKVKRVSIFKSIMDNCEKGKWRVSKIICSPFEIDREMRENNLNKLEVKLFASAIEKIGFSKEIGYINVDACDVNEKRFGDNIKKELGDKWKSTKIISKHKMDEIDLVTGAASIIAKVTRDSEIEKINKDTDFEIGSGYPSDSITRNAVKRMIAEGCPHNELRWSWKTVKDIWIQTHKSPVPVRSELGEKIAQKTLQEWTK